MTSQDVIPSGEMQIDPLRIDIDLARFLLMGRNFFLVGRELLAGGEIFLSVEIFFTGREFFCRSRICFGGREFFTGRTVFARSRVFQLPRVFVGSGRFSRHNVSRGINNMASSDGISTGNICLGKFSVESAIYPTILFKHVFKFNFMGKLSRKRIFNT